MSTPGAGERPVGNPAIPADRSAITLSRPAGRPAARGTPRPELGRESSREEQGAPGQQAPHTILDREVIQNEKISVGSGDENVAKIQLAPR